MKHLDKVLCFDIEANGFEADRIWVFSARELIDGVPTRDFNIHDPSKIAEFISTYNGYMVAHNGIAYDVPTLERLLKVKVSGKMIDSLALSWYLNPKRMKHGLEGYGEDFGVPKPVVIDWMDETLIPEYTHRCEEDVKIQTKLWLSQWKQLGLLYDKRDDAINCMNYLTSKMVAVAIASKGWKLDVGGCNKLLEEITVKTVLAKAELESGMPKVAKYSIKTRPKKPFKKDGTHSATGVKWKEITDEAGKDFDYDGEIKVLRCYDEPNCASHSQVKGWLHDLGWTPTTFKYVRKEGDRHPKAIPQIKKDDDLCPSVARLISKSPAIAHLDTLGMLNHRKSILTGFLRNENDGIIRAQMSGFTNTLRLKHKTLVNLPSTRKPYGAELRGLLVASEGNCLLGSDMCSLESMIAQHYCMPLDPDYVKSLQTEGYDPHLNIATVANMLTEDEIDLFKSDDCPKDHKEEVSVIRYNAKQVNYSATYGIGYEGLARNTGMSEDIAKNMLEAFWKLNWSFKAVAENRITKKSRDLTWIWNDVANMWYWLKTDKDRWSTTCQGTASFVFDQWVNRIMEKRPQINGQFHDEIILELIDTPKRKEAATKFLKDCIADVNKTYQLNTTLDVDIQFGKNYGEIH